VSHESRIEAIKLKLGFKRQRIVIRFVDGWKPEEALRSKPEVGGSDLKVEHEIAMERAKAGQKR
jgi:hypothetical protein